MKFTSTELVFIEVMMEKIYNEYVKQRNKEIKWKEKGYITDDTDVTKKHMEIIENISEKIREELGI